MYPKYLLENTYWAFRGKPFDNQDAFNQAVSEYIALIKGDETELADHWQPEEIVIPKSQKICIIYEGLDEEIEELEEKCFFLETRNTDGFTAGELLRLVHNQVCEELSKIDYIYFEGFELASEKNGSNDDASIPTYWLCQGS